MTDFKHFIYVLLVFAVPALIVVGSWILLNPVGFWQKLVMAIISIPEYLLFLWVCVQIIEAIDR